MQERFKRAFKILENESKFWDYETYTKVLYEDALDLRWLRNAAKLWSDYEEDVSWVIKGIHYDPNHPDNLSEQVYNTWKEIRSVNRLTELVTEK